MLKTFVKIQYAKRRLLSKALTSKKKGNVSVELIAFIAILLIICFPIYKDALQTVATSIKTWFTTAIGNILKDTDAIK